MSETATTVLKYTGAVVGGVILDRVLIRGWRAFKAWRS